MDTKSWLRQQAEAIARRGSDVHAQIAALVAGASAGVREVAGGMVEVARSVLDGAADGAKQAVPADRDRTLHAVVDGIADGVAVTAQAAKLALSEAAGGARRYVREDVDRLTNELRTLPERLVDTVLDTADRIAGRGSEQARVLAEHAKVALRRATPAVESALAAAATDPVGLAKQTAAATAGAARGAAGAFFTALAKELDRLGAKLRPPDEGGAPPA